MVRSASPRVLLDLERVVVASVAITARALADVAPELTLVQWRVLVLVDESAGIGVGALATALDAKIAATSRLVGRLRAHGLVDTRRGSDDARVVLVNLTPNGARIRARVLVRRREELRSAVEAAHLPAGADAVVERLAVVLEAIG